MDITTKGEIMLWHWSDHQKCLSQDEFDSLVPFFVFSVYKDTKDHLLMGNVIICVSVTVDWGWSYYWYTVYFLCA